MLDKLLGRKVLSTGGPVVSFSHRNQARFYMGGLRVAIPGKPAMLQEILHSAIERHANIEVVQYAKIPSDPEFPQELRAIDCDVCVISATDNVTDGVSGELLRFCPNCTFIVLTSNGRSARAFISIADPSVDVFVDTICLLADRRAKGS